MIRRFSEPSSICSVKFSSWLVHDFPARNPACSGISFASTCSAIRFSMSRSNSLWVWQSKEIGRKLFAMDGSFPGFNSATTLACRQSFGIFLVSVQLLKKRSSQSRALDPNCLISSVWMSSRPGALPFFSTLMPMSSSSALNALMNPGSYGYRCRSRRTFVQ